MATKKTTRPAKAATKTAREAKTSKKTSLAANMSQMAAAERVLAEAGEPMNCKAMVEVMSVKGYWSSPGGKTPAATLYASLLRHIQKHGKVARFVKTERGLFTLASK